MELDGFCRNLVKQAPAHLEEGGFLQMLCEWPEIEGQPWEERLAEWFAGTGCDAVVFRGRELRSGSIRPGPPARSDRSRGQGGRLPAL